MQISQNELHYLIRISTAYTLHKNTEVLHFFAFFFFFLRSKWSVIAIPSQGNVIFKIYLYISGTSTAPDLWGILRKKIQHIQVLFLWGKEVKIILFFGCVQNFDDIFFWGGNPWYFYGIYVNKSFIFWCIFCLFYIWGYFWGGLFFTYLFWGVSVKIWYFGGKINFVWRA